MFLRICDGLLGRHNNVTRSKFGELERARFSKRKTLLNLHRSLFLSDLLLVGDKTFKVLSILEFGFL